VCAAVMICCSGWLVIQPYALHSAHHTRASSGTRTTAATPSGQQVTPTLVLQANYF
jgi:hypothetical protein